MNAEKFFKLMNTLPDDMLVSAVRSEPKRNRKPMYIVSAIAACLVIGVTAVVYPKLKVQPPEIHEPDVTVTETTAVSSTTGTETDITMPSTISVATTFSESSISTVSTASPTVSTAQTTTSEFAALTFTTVQRTKASTQTPTETSALKTHDTEPVRTTSMLVTESVPNTTTLLPVFTVPSTTEQTAEFTSYPNTTDLQQGTIANAEQTGTTADNSYSTTISTERKETETPLDYWILKQTVMEEEPIHRIREWKLYREGLPDDLAYDAEPDIDFSRYDCLIVHFSAYTYADDPSHGYYPISMNYQIKIFPVYDKPVGTVVEYVMAFPIPKTLYADTAPDGVRDIQIGMGISGNSEMICKLVYWEDT